MEGGPSEREGSPSTRGGRVARELRSAAVGLALTAAALFAIGTFAFDLHAGLVFAALGVIGGVAIQVGAEILAWPARRLWRYAWFRWIASAIVLAFMAGLVWAALSEPAQSESLAPCGEVIAPPAA